MGIPQEPQPQPSSPPSSSTATSSTPPSASSLPPEALALASKLFDLARSGATQTLRQYITAGIPPNLTNHAGDTLLMLAAYHGHADTTAMLLDMGAYADAINDRGQSPVAGAVFKGWADVVRVLVRKGCADVDAGQPSAREAAVMFRRGGMYEVLGVEE